MEKKERYFVDEKGNKYYRGYIDGSIADDILSGMWFAVRIKNNAVYISSKENQQKFESMNRRYVYGLIRDSIYNGEKIVTKPNHTSTVLSFIK